MENSAIKTILERRSVRKYQDRPVPRESLTLLLRAAMSAPSACNQQSWHFVVIEDRDVLNELSNIHDGFLTMRKSPLVVLVCGEPQRATLEYYWEYDCSAATENMLIAAQALGLGAVWMGINQRSKQDSEIVRRILNIPENLQPFSFVSVGYPDNATKPADRFDESKIHYGRFGK